MNPDLRAFAFARRPLPLRSFGENPTGGGALFSECGAFRMMLWRTWSDGPQVTFVMLNPSTADATHDDPTIRRCVGFAKREGFGCLVVVNLFNFRATKPKDLFQASDPIGADPIEHGFDAPAVGFEARLIETRAPDLDLDGVVAQLEIAFDLFAQTVDVLARVIVASGRIDPNRLVARAAVETLAEQLIERLSLDLGGEVPQRHVEDADSYRPLAVTARLFVRHHDLPTAMWIDVLAGIVKQGLGDGRR